MAPCSAQGRGSVLGSLSTTSKKTGKGLRDEKFAGGDLGEVM